MEESFLMVRSTNYNLHTISTTSVFELQNVETVVEIIIINLQSNASTCILFFAHYLWTFRLQLSLKLHERRSLRGLEELKEPSLDSRLQGNKL
jgi:hypothetical protein